ncbi:PqqD family protein [Xylanibacter brevis]|uniref:PqqD family protein n=1 Tax=Xylanibacter brevis TaxID=83231 RepID=UPI000483AB87|nr:PqqD family protein [Xylanibacter brevis]
MKTKKGFRLRNICGENVIVAEGIENIDFSRIISMNESAAYLWNKVQSIDFTANTLIDLLLEEYEVSREDAAQDVNQLIEQWQKAGIVED